MSPIRMTICADDQDFEHNQNDVMVSVRNTFIHYGDCDGALDRQPALVRSKTVPSMNPSQDNYSDSSTNSEVGDLDDDSDSICDAGIPHFKTFDKLDDQLFDIDTTTFSETFDEVTHVVRFDVLDVPFDQDSTEDEDAQQDVQYPHTCGFLERTPATFQQHDHAQQHLQMPAVFLVPSMFQSSPFPSMMASQNGSMLSVPTSLVAMTQSPMVMASPCVSEPSSPRTSTFPLATVQGEAQFVSSASNVLRYRSSPIDEQACMQARPRAAPKGKKNNSQVSQRTTVMIRNLPNNYSRSSLQELIDSLGFFGKYDFLYFPVDFRTHAALGYAFLNMVTAGDAEALRCRLDGFTDWAFPSVKVCNVGWSHPHQGLEGNIERYRNSPLMHEDVPDEYRPLLFADGKRIAFPAPTKRIKPPRQGTQRMLV